MSKYSDFNYQWSNPLFPLFTDRGLNHFKRHTARVVLRELGENITFLGDLDADPLESYKNYIDRIEKKSAIVRKAYDEWIDSFVAWNTEALEFDRKLMNNESPCPKKFTELASMKNKLFEDLRQAIGEC